MKIKTYILFFIACIFLLVNSASGGIAYPETYNYHNDLDEQVVFKDNPLVKIPKDIAKHASSIWVYRFNRDSSNTRIVDPENTTLIYSKKLSNAESDLDDGLRSSLRESNTFLSYVFRGNILKIDIQYITQFPELMKSDSINVKSKSYLIFPIVWNNVTLIGYGILIFDTNIDTLYPESIAKLSQQLAEIYCYSKGQ